MSQNFYRPENAVKNVSIEPYTKLIRQKLDRPLVLVGLMGAGKSRLGRLIAKNINVPFYDSDLEIEQSAGRTVREVLAEIGEQAFRSAEIRVLHRLIEEGVSVVATGGGTNLSSDAMDELMQRAHVMWVRASYDVMMARLTRGTNLRPLLDGKDVAETLQGLMKALYPVYERAHVVVDSFEGPAGETLLGAMTALADSLDKRAVAG